MSNKDSIFEGITSNRASVLKSNLNDTQNEKNENHMIILVTISNILEGQGPYLDEEWERIYEFLSVFTSSKQFISNNEVKTEIKKVFTIIRTLYIQNQYNGSVKGKMD